MKVCVITPYYQEEDETLLKCIKSVEEQTYPCEHYLIADGPVCKCTTQFDVARHVVLGQPHKDYGNTPRGIGGLLAISEGADAVAFLDADCVYDKDHIETCVELANKHPGTDFVVARRRIVLPDGTSVPDCEEPLDKHVDTNCFFLLSGAFHAIPQQALQPRELTIVGDRLFLARLQGLRCVATERPTLTYVSEWRAHYELAKVEPPPNAKRTVDMTKLESWWRGRTPMERAIVLRRLGLKRLWW